MTTRLVSIDQVWPGKKKPAKHIVKEGAFFLATLLHDKIRYSPIKVVQVPDVSGGDSFEPVDGIAAAFIEILRQANWPHPVQVEVVNG